MNDVPNQAASMSEEDQLRITQSIVKSETPLVTAAKELEPYLGTELENKVRHICRTARMERKLFIQTVAQDKVQKKAAGA